MQQLDGIGVNATLTNQLIVSYEESERDCVDKELYAFLRRYVGGRN